jgi:GT2 family glycosyltransferase
VTQLTHDSTHLVTIIIPTVGKPEVLIPSFAQLCARLDGLPVHIVLSLNPIKPEDGQASYEECTRIWNRIRPEGSFLTCMNAGRPVGFGGAINRALTGLDASGIGIAPYVIVWNDDLRVTHGWLKRQIALLSSPTIEEWSEVPDPETGARPVRKMEDYLHGSKGIGLFGPMTNCAAGIQQISPDAMEVYNEVGTDEFATRWQEANPGRVMTADFLSGYCLGMTRELVQELMSGEQLFDERYVIAGYEDNDLCVRAAQAGYRAVVTSEVFIGHIGHQTFDASFPEMGRGMRNRLVYYEKYQSHEPLRLTGIMRLRIEAPSDVDYLRMMLVRHGSLLDHLVVLLTASPTLLLEHPDVKQFGMDWLRGKLASDAGLILGAQGKENDDLCAHIQTWMQGWLHRDLPNTPSRKPGVQVGLWVGDFNERDERNALLELAQTTTNPNWILSIDHDEALEPRVTRALLERLVCHPDPLVQSFDIGFLNHWENNRMYRIDRPWGDGGTWTGGMRGYRLFRVGNAPKRILAGGNNGLHCGNVPGSDPMTKRVAGFVFRHFGYMQHPDRVRKEARYNRQDPNPDPILVGGTSYGHITDDSTMTLMPFVQESGIGMHMLLHKGESADDLGRILDAVYGLVDRIVLVWTEEQPLDSTSDIARMAACFGAEWIHHPLRDDLASARNAALDRLMRYRAEGLGWSWFCDPDEYLPYQAPVILRRMSQAPDCWGWIFRFQNPTSDAQSSVSEAVRMARLHPNMRLTGRVHESFDASVRALRQSGIGKVLRTAPDALLCHNRGLTGSPAQQQAKLERYRKWTEQELRENPYNAGAWTTLGLYWENMGESRMAEECFGRGVAVATTEYLPYQELALLYTRRAAGLFHEASVRMGSHRMRGPWEKLRDILNGDSMRLPLMGLPTQEGWVSPYQDMPEVEKFALLPPPPPSGDIQG